MSTDAVRTRAGAVAAPPLHAVADGVAALLGRTGPLASESLRLAAELLR